MQYRGKSFQSNKYASNDSLNAHYTSAEETWQIISPYLKKIGVTRIANVTGLDRIGIPVFNAIRPNFDGYTTAHGKGISVESAKISACMESLERYYGSTKKYDFVTMSYNELSKRFPVIPYEKLPLTIHSIFTEDLPVRWTAGWDIVHQEEVMVPLEVALLMYKSPPERLLLFMISSNGLAAGTNFVEAVCQGLYEVIERDAVTCSYLASRSAGVKIHHLKKIRLETIPYPAVTDLIRQIEDAGIMVLLYDNTVDTEVPTYNSYLLDIKEPYNGVTHGMGSSLDPCTAMIRAITEAVQARAILNSGVRDIFFHDQYDFFKVLNANTIVRSLADEVREEVDASGLVSEATATFEGDINVCLKKLQNVGLDQVVVFECTEPGSDLSVVKIVVPGLEGYMHSYYARGQRARSYSRETDPRQPACTNPVHSY
jgi:YcaO-like protein with predicted kinase domain